MTFVRDLSETALLAAMADVLPRGPRTSVPTGDDCMVLDPSDGRVCVTTDVLVEGRHFRRDWSSPQQIGRRAVAQNLADVAAMGAVPISIVVGLVLPGDTELAWATALGEGIADACRDARAGVDGGDLVGGDAVVLSITAFGDLQGRAPVLRSGARPGDVVAHIGDLGRSAAGLALQMVGARDEEMGAARGVHPDGTPRGRAASGNATKELDALGGVMSRQIGEALPGMLGSGVDFAAPVAWSSESAELAEWAREGYRAPDAPLAAGPAAALAGATSMMDVSDGLLRDAGRIAAASGVVIDLHTAGRVAAARARLAPLEALLGGEDYATERKSAPRQKCGSDGAPRSGPVLGFDALTAVLTGGEDHGLLATFPEGTTLPEGWETIGRVLNLAYRGDDQRDGGDDADPHFPHDSPRVLLDGADPARLGVQGVGWDHFRA